jgi:hypothetical protein
MKRVGGSLPGGSGAGAGSGSGSGSTAAAGGRAGAGASKPAAPNPKLGALFARFGMAAARSRDSGSDGTPPSRAPSAPKLQPLPAPAPKTAAVRVAAAPAVAPASAPSAAPSEPRSADLDYFRSWKPRPAAGKPAAGSAGAGARAGTGARAGSGSGAVAAALQILSSSDDDSCSDDSQEEKEDAEEAAEPAAEADGGDGDAGMEAAAGADAPPDARFFRAELFVEAGFAHTCSVCTEAWREPVETVECGHVFCLKCLKTWCARACAASRVCSGFALNEFVVRAGCVRIRRVPTARPS